MTTKRRYATSEPVFTAKRIRNILAVLFVITLLVSGAFATTGTNVVNQAMTSRNASFPVVPETGTPLIPVRTQFHPTGLISLPALQDWNPPGTEDGGLEKLVVSDGPNGTGRVGIMLINSSALSVIHAFAEHDDAKVYNTVQELDASYTRDALQGAWASYTRWTELSRRIEGDLSVIEFELQLEGDRSGVQNTDVYRARQLSRMENGWLLVMRLVAPENNTALLDRLQQTLWPRQRLYVTALTAPLSWNAIIDEAERYIVRYPSQWTLGGGAPNNPFTVTGPLISPTTGTADEVTLTTRTYPDAPMTNEAEARAWVTANVPGAVTLRAVQDTPDMWTVSYSVPDADGNARSGISTMKRAEGKLYVITIRVSGRGLDLLDPVVTPNYPEMAWIRASLTVVPADALATSITAQ